MQVWVSVCVLLIAQHLQYKIYIYTCLYINMHISILLMLHYMHFTLYFNSPIRQVFYVLLRLRER